MKKKFLMISTLAAVFFGSCVSENENPAPFKAGETVEVKFKVGLESSPKTRLSDGSGYSNLNLANPGNYSLRYKVAVYSGPRSGITATTVPLHTDSALVDLPATAKQQEFSFRLTLGTTYTVIGWADFVDKASDVTFSADKFYDTSGFPDITLKDAAFRLNEEAKDAYFGVWEEPLSADVIEVPLKRPFGKIRFLVSDYTTTLTDGDRTALNLSTEYSSDYLLAPPTGAVIYTKLDMLTGDVSGNATLAQRGYYVTQTIPTNTADRIVENGELAVFWDYILAPSAAQLTAGTAKPRIEFRAEYSGMIDGSPITPDPSSVTYNDTRIVVERNKLTTVRADLFGEAPTIVRLSIEDDFEKPELEPLKAYVVYTDGGTGTINVARDADGVGSFRCPGPVRAITVNGRDSIYIGTTKGFQTVTLKFDANGAIVLRGNPATSTPIPVNSIAELELIKTDATTLGGHYVLEADVDLLSMEWTPIGSLTGISFSGTFDGAGHTIRNLKISSGDYVGFFGTDGSSSVIKNLGVSGNVSGGDHIGGLISGAAGTITACSFNGTVTGNYVGGLVGYTRNTGSTITACHVGGNVTGTVEAGGLVGHINTGNVSITACYSTATVTGSGRTGSLYGNNSAGGTITGCFTTGAAQLPDVLQFSGADWPVVNTATGWGECLPDLSDIDTNHWKSIGSWNGSITNSVYPKLWWEK